MKKPFIFPLPLFAALLFWLLTLPPIDGQVKIGGGAKVGGTVKTSVQSGGAPVDFVNDTFTGDEGFLINNHTGETGATWTQHPAYTTATMTILTGWAHKDTASGTASYYASGVAANVNYTVEATIIDRTNSNRSSGGCGWVDTTNNTMVCVRRTNATTVELMKIINGTATTGLATTTVTYTQDQSRTYAVTRNGTDYTATLDGVSFGTVSITDTELSGVGRVGMRQTTAWTVDSGYPIDRIRAYQ